MILSKGLRSDSTDSWFEILTSFSKVALQVNSTSFRHVGSPSEGYSDPASYNLNALRNFPGNYSSPHMFARICWADSSGEEERNRSCLETELEGDITSQLYSILPPSWVDPRHRRTLWFIKSLAVLVSKSYWAHTVSLCWVSWLFFSKDHVILSNHNGFGLVIVRNSSYIGKDPRTDISWYPTGE